jgi:hypothetical protein
VLKEFATKRHVKLSRVMVKAKDDEAAKKPAKPRRRRGTNGGGEREESDRSLAKVRSCLLPSALFTRTSPHTQHTVHSNHRLAKSSVDPSGRHRIIRRPIAANSTIFSTK